MTWRPCCLKCPRNISRRNSTGDRQPERKSGKTLPPVLLLRGVEHCGLVDSEPFKQCRRGGGAAGEHAVLDVCVALEGTVMVSSRGSAIQYSGMPPSAYPCASPLGPVAGRRGSRPRRPSPRLASSGPGSSTSRIICSVCSPGAQVSGMSLSGTCLKGCRGGASRRAPDGESSLPMHQQALPRCYGCTSCRNNSSGISKPVPCSRARR